MKGIPFPQQTAVFGKPAGWKDEDCYGLPVSQAYYGNSDGFGVPCLISYWEKELTDAEIQEIISKRKLGVFLSITGAGMPPVSVYTENPFPEDYDKDRAAEIHKKLAEAQAKGERIHLNNL